MAGLLDGVSEIEWSRLKHAYGSAEKVPRWLAAMTDSATSTDALAELDTAVYHQGGSVYSAGAAVVPFLIRFAQDPTVPDRPEILDLLARFAALHNQMTEPWKSRPAALTCRAALLTGFDILVGLLDEPEPAIQRGAVETLVELRERADQLADELMARLPAEVDPDVASDYVLALATLGAANAFTPGKQAAVAASLSHDTPPPGDPRRLTFLVALHRLGGDAVTVEQLLEAYAGAVPQRTVGWLGPELGNNRTARLALARIGISQAVHTGQQRPLAEVGTVMAKWRSATTTLAADVAAALDGPATIQPAVVHLLAVTGDVGRRWSETVAARIGQPGRVGALATWALARWGDHRAVPIVVRSLHRNPEIFSIGSSHYTDSFYWLEQDPAVADVCAPLATYADELVPAIRWRLRNDQTTPTAYQLTQILTAYGTAALAALPELTAMLDTDHRGLACAVLAGLGPATREVQAKLTQLATSDGRDATTAAWAVFRTTGDPEPLLARTGTLGAERITASTARQLGDLGPLATPYVSSIEQQLTEDPQFWRTWEGIELGFAHYRITGDPALCLNILDAALDPLRHSQQLPVSRQALRHVARLGPVAADFAPLLRGAVEQDERLRYSGGWRGITEDDEARTLAHQALTAIAP